jgi:CRISP-associated protein Cas1
MPMATLYIDRKGAEIRWRDGALELRIEGDSPRVIPGKLLDRIVLRAETCFTSTTLAALAQAGIGVLAHGGRGGQRIAHLLGAPAADCAVRIAQCQRVSDEPWAAAVARHLVLQRLRGQARVLREALEFRPDLRKPLIDALATVEASQAKAVPAEHRATLRGLEGAGAAAFFRGYTHLFATSLGFQARRRRPPPDPVNACLSLGYTLLHAQAVQACWASGLDPMVGFLHLPCHGRESLACDLVEPWRAHVERWVWRQFAERHQRPEHFGRDGAGACVIGKAGRAQFYQSIDPLQQRCGKGMRRHAQALARALAPAANVPSDDGWSTDPVTDLGSYPEHDRLDSPPEDATP